MPFNLFEDTCRTVSALHTLPTRVLLSATDIFASSAVAFVSGFDVTLVARNFLFATFVMLWRFWPFDFLPLLFSGPRLPYKQYGVLATSAQELMQFRYGKYFSANTEITDPSPYNERVATTFGYSTEDLESLCGVSDLDGETVIDLGPREGLDVFTSGHKVGLREEQ
ncbi:hypothetical protein HOY80DRAFT_1061663 [Tuber brumale]|nr:hypothetical protein HOY80DRAFT_1061663 [Tuber brumale]